MPLRGYAKKLDKLYRSLNRRKYVHPDPLEFLYNYDDPADREVVGLIASSLAYGRVGQILNSVRKVLDKLGENPARRLVDLKKSSASRMFADFRHRFQTGSEITALLCGIGGVVRKLGSLEAAYLAGGLVGRERHRDALGGFVKSIDPDGRCGHLLPDPARGSACKRLHLFLRWMVRCDDVDPGGWRKIIPGDLVIPLDTHMHKIALAMGATKRKTASIVTALEITEAFGTIAPEDPVKYDFALTRLGIRNDMDFSTFLDNE